VDEVEERSDGKAVRTSDGAELERITAKMSKSLRNVVTPDEVVSEYGADTLRMYLMFMGPLESQRIWDAQAINGVYRFLKRSWTLVTDNRDEGVRDLVDAATEPEVCVKAIHRATKGVTEDLEMLSLNTAISKLMECLNDLVGQPISRDTAERYVKLLAPFAAHLAEELWQRLGHAQTLAYEAWPTWDETVLEESNVEVVIQVNGKKRGSVQAARDAADEILRDKIVAEMAGSNFAVSHDDRFIVVRQKNDGVPKLVNVIAQRRGEA
jgi:leucyl-tRNA synthetase